MAHILPVYWDSAQTWYILNFVVHLALKDEPTPVFTEKRRET